MNIFYREKLDQLFALLCGIGPFMITSAIEPTANW